MSSLDSNLITTYNFNGRDHLVKMDTLSDLLELAITDKQTGEQWQCSYDVTYVETLTRKTGNFKQFEIFIAMLKSGLLKTTDCIVLDLLTLEDLENLKVGKVRKSNSFRRLLSTNSNTNKRYLIITYSVEFDRINYPLPLEYCGLPDPVILQTTIKRLELELAKSNARLENNFASEKERQRIKVLQKRVEELLLENLQLKEQVNQLKSSGSSGSKKTKGQVEVLQKAITRLEKNVIMERNSHHKLVDKLQSEKKLLTTELEKMKVSEKIIKDKLRKLSAASFGIAERDTALQCNVPSTKHINIKTLRSASSPTTVRKKSTYDRSNSTARRYSTKRERRRRRLDSHSNKSEDSRSSSKSSKINFHSEHQSLLDSDAVSSLSLSSLTSKASPHRSITSRSSSVGTRKEKKTNRRRRSVNKKKSNRHAADSPTRTPRHELAKLEMQIQKIYQNQKMM